MPSYTYTRKKQLRIIKQNKGVKTIIIFIGALVIITIFVQLYVMSLFANRNGEVAEMQARKEVLIAENKNLQHEIAVARNLEYIKKQSANIGYVDIKMDDVKYMTVE